jgi:hypothetical protein
MANKQASEHFQHALILNLRSLALALPEVVEGDSCVKWSVGKGGWAMLKFDQAETPPAGLLERWLDESYRLQVPKALVATLSTTAQSVAT